MLLLGRVISLLPLNEELNDLYCSSNIIWVMKSGRMRWVVHVTRVVTGEVHTDFCWGNPRERDHLEDPDIDGRTTLRLIMYPI